MVAIFNQHFCQREGEAIHVVDIALQEENTTLLIGHRCSIRQLRCGTKSIKDRFFVVVTGNTFLLTENP